MNKVYIPNLNQLREMRGDQPVYVSTTMGVPPMRHVTNAGLPVAEESTEIKTIIPPITNPNEEKRL